MATEAVKPLVTIITRRITSLMSVKNTKGEIIAYKANCNHKSPPEMKLFKLSDWGSIAYDLASDWALNHKCRGDIAARVREME